MGYIEGGLGWEWVCVCRGRGGGGGGRTSLVCFIQSAAIKAALNRLKS